jgi:hypothetical protein
MKGAGAGAPTTDGYSPNKGFFSGAREGTPEQETLGRGSPPALTRVSVSVSCLTRMTPAPFLDGQTVEQQHALARPVDERVRVGLASEIALHLGENVAQARRRPNSMRHRKREPVRLTFPVIRILAEDYDADRIERCLCQRVQRLRRIDLRPSRPALGEER